MGRTPLREGQRVSARVEPRETRGASTRRRSWATFMVAAVVSLAAIAASAVPAFAGTLTPPTGSSLNPPALYVDGSAEGYTSETITTSDTCSAASPCNWSASNLPAGLTITRTAANDGQTANITGVPTSGVTTRTNVGVTQTGGVGGNSTATYTLSVIERLTSAGSFNGNLDYPTGLVGDTSNSDNQYVYVAGSKSDSIWAINANVNPPRTAGKMTGFAGFLHYPNQLFLPRTSATATVPPNLYAGNYNQFGPNNPPIGSPPGVSTGPDTVARVDLGALGAHVPGTNGQEFNLNNVCDKPAGMARGGDAQSTTLFVACAGSGNVVVLNANTGAFQNSYVLDANGSDPGVGCPAGSHVGEQPVPSGAAPTNQAGRAVIADARCDELYMVGDSAHGNGQLARVQLPLPPAEHSTYAANVAFANTGGQFAYVTEPGIDQVAQVQVGAGAALTYLQSRNVGNRPYGIATNVTYGFAGQPMIVGEAGPPATARVFTEGAGGNWVQRYAIHLPDTNGGTPPIPVGSATAVPAPGQNQGQEPAFGFIADTGDNSVYVIASGAAAATRTPFVLTLSGKRVQHLRRVVTVTAHCSRNCTAHARGRFVIKPRRFARQLSRRAAQLRRVTAHLSAGNPKTLRLGVKRRARHVAREALKHGGKVKAKLTVTATDAAGQTRTARRTVRPTLRSTAAPLSRHGSHYRIASYRAVQMARPLAPPIRP